MAGIYVFWKPVTIGGINTGANRAFLLYQNDAGTYTDIARGGPQPLCLECRAYRVGGIGQRVGWVEPFAKPITRPRVLAISILSLSPG
jgi:hypothetical protein